MPLYVGSFSFESADLSKGHFEIVVESATLHRAENACRKKVKEYFSTRPEMLPARIFLLDIIEIENAALPTMLLFKKERPVETGSPGSQFFSPLPLREAHATSWTASMPGNPELFLELD